MKMTDNNHSLRTISLSFDIQTTLLLKTVCCFVIALHHYSLNHIYTLRTISDNNLFSKLGYIAVGLFFFLSAYGNTVTFKKDINLIYSIGKKLKNIFIPYFFAHFSFLVILCLFVSDYDYNKHIIDTFMFNGPFWFLKVLVLFIVVTEYVNRYITKSFWQIFAIGLALTIYYYFNLSYEGYLRLSTYAYLCGFLFAKFRTVSLPVFILAAISLIISTIIGYIYIKELGQVSLCCLTSCIAAIVVNHIPVRAYIPKSANNFSFFVYLSHMYFVPFFVKYDVMSVTTFLAVASIASIVLLFIYKRLYMIIKI